MFTGLVRALGRVVVRREEGPGLRLGIESPEIAVQTAPGDSVCVSGCCLTAVSLHEDCMEFDLGEETLRRTTLGRLREGAKVNLEPSLRLGDPLGGHLVTGHVDGVGTLAVRDDHGDWSDFVFRAPRKLMAHMAEKGSIAVDGVSLTLVAVDDATFRVALIPHTLAVTTLGGLKVGSEVNLETDILAKYVERQLAWRAG